MRLTIRKNDDFQKLTDEYEKIKYKCSCGHKIIIPKWIDKQVCDWCGRYVFKTKQDEFKFRLQEKMRRVNNGLYRF